jgi:hypothetical protein
MSIVEEALSDGSFSILFTCLAVTAALCCAAHSPDNAVNLII